MEGFDPATSFGDEESKRYDAISIRGDEEQTVAFLPGLADGREALEFAVECAVPTAPTRPDHQFVDAARVEVDHVTLDACRYDPITQILDINHVQISAGGVVMRPIRLRLAQPPEFDLRLAGLTLRDRWGGWNGEPFDATSWRHISVFARS